MKNLTTPKAVLIGLAMIALAILFQPAVSRLIISPAYAEGLDSSDFRMFWHSYSVHSSSERRQPSWNVSFT